MIDSSIPMGIQLPKIEDPANAMLKILQMRNYQQEGDMNALKAESTRRDFDRTNKLYQLAQDNTDPAMLPGVLRKNGYLKEAGDLEKGQADLGKTKSETNKNDSETENKTVSMYRDASQAITDPQSAIDFVTHMHSDPRLANSAIARIPLDAALKQIPQDPSQLGAWKQQFALGASKFMELNKPTTNVVNTGKTTQMVQTPGLGGAPTVAQTFTNTVSPDTEANNATSIRTTGMNNATSRANNAANIGKDYRINGLNPDGTDPNGTVGGLTPEAIDNAAKRYNFDGTLPPSIGRGTQGSRDLRAIQNRAAELNQAAPGDASGGRAGQMANKADAAAFSKLNSQQQMASSFERTANANADIALGLSKKMDRTGVPIINAGIQAWRTGTGSPEATQFAAANETFVNEYAKIMSGGMGSGPVTDGARNKAHSLLSTSMTPEQYEGNVKLLQREMQNRMKGYQDQANEITTRLHGNTQPGAASPTAGGMPSSSAIDAELARRGHK